MQLNEIIEENTLPTISKRTRISRQNLEALVDRDWSRLQKVQALGFISILEREYGIDLSDMRQECRAYFASHEPPQEKRQISVGSQEADYAGSRRIFKIAAFAVLAFLAYASWRYFVAKNPTLESNTTITKKESFYDSALKMAEGWFGGKKIQSETPDLGEESEVAKGAWAEEKNDSAKASASERNATPQKAESPLKEAKEPSQKASAAKVAAVEKNATSTSPEEKEEREEAQIIEKVKAEQAKQEEQISKAGSETSDSGSEAAEAHPKASEEISQMIAAATPHVKDKDTDSEASTLQATPPSMRKDSSVSAPKPLETAATGKKRPAAKKQKTQAAKSPAKSAPSATAKEVILLHPLKKTWVGYTNLRNMKRVAKVTAADIPFDTSKGDYILATGHGMVEFRNADGTVLKLNDGKRHFFMIAKGGVREISHEAFQRLNKSKVW